MGKNRSSGRAWIRPSANLTPAPQPRDLWPVLSQAGPKAIHSIEDVAGVSLVAQTVKHPPAIQETWVRSLGREDPLEKEMLTLSSILAWRVPRTEEPWWATVHGVSKSRT